MVPKHCVMCGSGDIIGNSDGTNTCNYCESTFSVQLEPAFPAMPMDDGSMGNPVDAEQANDPDAAAMGEDPSARTPLPGPPDLGAADPAGGGADPAGGGGVDDDQLPPTSARRRVAAPEPMSMAKPRINSTPDKVDQAEEGTHQHLSFITAEGLALSEADYLDHLAIKHATPVERPMILARRRATPRRTR
jgi:hypothetical protein